MVNLDRNRIKHKWNRFRGIPIEWDLDEYRFLLDKVNSYELGGLSAQELKDISTRLREHARQGRSLDDLLPEAYALVRETAERTIGLRPFDVQVLAGIALHQSKLAEMNTGEGKTLAAVFPAYLNALTGRGVHIHTFNDYLARRDAAWMGPIYTFLGLSVGSIQQGMPAEERKRAYAADIIYTTAKEAGFDFLRDQLCTSEEDLVHRDFHFAIVDEADSLLIDEARAPLVIAGTTGMPKVDASQMAELVKGLREGVDFETDDGKRNIYLTDRGLERFEAILKLGSLHDPENLDALTKLNLALHAEFLIHREIDYIVRNGKVEIVDEFTGRVVEDRQWPDGLQAAIEAKEKLVLGSGGSVLGSITLQHFLKLYPRLCGMTATARPSAEEIKEFYGLSVAVIPPNRPCIRRDEPDVVFTHKAAKARALIVEISQVHASGRPILVGTASVEESEELAAMLEEAGVGCQVLNAKNDELEAGIIARAGELGAVTISTNMAGRGTDIKLGGEAELEREMAVGLGGLYVIGTNRHESLRIDQQLRGRAGRQGDPGTSRFFVSLEDYLIDRYGILNLLPKKYHNLKLESPIVDMFVNREIERGQRIIEGQNFEIRKTLRKYSSLMEMQRDLIQRRRREILAGEAPSELLAQQLPEHYIEFESSLGSARLHEVERQITLFHLDRCWAEHLAQVADIRESIHLVSVGGNPPINEFHKLVNAAFLELDHRIEEKVLHTFEALELKGSDLDLDEAGIRGPSSTWTYLISDNTFGSWVGLLQGTNIGFTAVAAGYLGPLYILLGLLRRRRWRKDNPLVQKTIEESVKDRAVD
ncbi:MAG: accessory Sec system translocase SecA2 [Candidatus Aminicenantaceae bacterium]